MPIEPQWPSRQAGGEPCIDREALMRSRTFWFALTAITVFAMATAATGERAGSTNEAALRKVFTGSIKPDGPGCGVGVMRDGRFLHASAYGLADVAGRKPLTTDSVFNIASVSKQFTAFSILLLDQRQQLSIDDRLTLYVPELTASAPDVTLRHLLHHIGGLRDYDSLLRLKGRSYEDGATQFETVELLGRQRGSNQPPGEEFEYSNSGYVLLATVIERVSGLSMKQFAAESIFGPLGMRHTTIVDRYPAGLPELARGYASGKKGVVVEKSAWEQVGDGQVHTTVSDLLLWAENFQTGRVGGRSLVRRMTQVGVLKSGEKLDYAAGLEISEYNGLPTVGHGGSWPGYLSDLLMFPQQRFAVSVLCNSTEADPSGLAKAVADIYLAAEMRSTGKTSSPPERPETSAPPARWQPAKLADYEGAYVSNEAAARCVLVERSGALYVEGCMPGYKLRPAGDQEFYSRDEGATLRFQERDGKPSGFTLHSSGLNGLAFKRR